MVYNNNHQDIFQQLEQISDNARLWIFQSDTPLTDRQVQKIKDFLDGFLVQWTSHSRILIAEGIVAYNHFVIIALDESRSSQASGCSIDALTHEIQVMANSLSINLLDRKIFYFLIEDSIIGYPMHEVNVAYKQGLITEDTLVFNNLIKTKGELHSSWLVPLKESWHKRFV